MNEATDQIRAAEMVLFQAALIERLVKFGGHDTLRCNCWKGRGYGKCDCGWNDVVKEVRKLRKERRSK